MTSSGEIALQLQDQGWRGLLPLLPHDATPHIRLAPDKAAEVASGRGKAPGRWARAGWSLLPDWRASGRCGDGRGVGAVARRQRRPAGVSCGPWVAFIDVDVLHPEAAAEIQVMLRRCLASKGEFSARIGNAPKFLIPVQTTEPVSKARSMVVEIDGQRHMVEVLGAGPAGRGRRHPPEDWPTLLLARWRARGDRARQAAAGDAGRTLRDPGRLQPHPAALRAGSRAQGPLDSAPSSTPSPSRFTSCGRGTRRSPWPPPSSSSIPTGAATTGWPGPTRCGAPSATLARSSGSGSLRSRPRPPIPPRPRRSGRTRPRLSATAICARVPAPSSRSRRRRASPRHRRRGCRPTSMAASRTRLRRAPIYGSRSSNGSSRAWPIPARARRRATPSPEAWGWARPPSRWKCWPRWLRA